MTTPITKTAAQQLRKQDYYEYLRLHEPRQYAEFMRGEGQMLKMNQFHASAEGQALLAELEAFFDQPEQRAAIDARRMRREVRSHVGSYTLLGIEQGASKREIKNAYRRQARKLHPDKGGDEAAFKALYAAYRQLLTITKD